MDKFYEQRFERLILIYFDAESLRRGFQFWLGCPGNADGLCDCVPLYFPPASEPLGLEKLLPGSHRDTLFLLCLPRGGVVADEKIRQFTEVLSRDNEIRSGLVVISASSHLSQTWRSHWPLPANLQFVAGRYTAHPETRIRENADDTHANRWNLRTVDAPEGAFQPAAGPQKRVKAPASVAAPA